MCVYDYDYKTKQAIESDQKNFNLKGLKSSLEHLDEKIAEITKNLSTRRASLVDQIRLVEQTQFRPFVLVQRNEFTNSGRIELKVYLRLLPNSPLILDQINSDQEIQVWRGQESILVRRGDIALQRILQGYDLSDYWFPTIGNKEFGGTERKKAFAYAQELAQEHKATVVKAGF